MKVLIASHNMGKVTEFKKILNNLGFEFMTLNDFHEVEEPEETGLTLNENSLIKAKVLSKDIPRILAIFALTDSSGNRFEINGISLSL